MIKSLNELAHQTKPAFLCQDEIDQNKKWKQKWLNDFEALPLFVLGQYEYAKCDSFRDKLAQEHWFKRVIAIINNIHEDINNNHVSPEIGQLMIDFFQVLRKKMTNLNKEQIRNKTNIILPNAALGWFSGLTLITVATVACFLVASPLLIIPIVGWAGIALQYAALVYLYANEKKVSDEARNAFRKTEIAFLCGLILVAVASLTAQLTLIATPILLGMLLVGLALQAASMIYLMDKGHGHETTLEKRAERKQNSSLSFFPYANLNKKNKAHAQTEAFSLNLASS